jgi:N-acetylmuramoyl-L-alanine amidase
MQLAKQKNILLKMRYILSLFLTIVLFSAPSFSQKKDTYGVRTVVIDPGHGGNKPGAIGSKTTEKAIVLSIAKKFGKLIADNYPDVKIIYTRTTDVDISLSERAHIANRNKADLFISIHANSHPTSSPTGVETFVMGLSESRANLAVAQKENADILLEADYKNNADYKGFDPNSPESYVMLTMFQNAYLDKSLNFAQAIQNQYKQNLKTINRGVKQAELFVLYKTTCPSVLTEVGFISNPGEEAFMMSDEGQAKIAISLFNAFMNFKAAEEGTGKLANPKIDIPGVSKSEAPQKEPVKETVVEIPEQKVVAPKPVEEEVPQAVEQKQIQEEEESAVVEVKTPVKESRPVPAAEIVTPPVPPTPPAPQSPSQSNTQASSNATEFYTVQFLTSNEELKAGAPEFNGLKDVMVTRNGKLYCYSVGRFATFADASAFCRQVQKETPFKDAWPLRRLSDKVQYLENVQSNPNTPSTPNTPKTQTSPKEKPAPAAKEKPAATTTTTGTVYRVQFCTSQSIFKVGAPDMHGIKDFQYVKSGKVYLYLAGDYKTLDEARKRCATIKNTTPFKDAFVVCYKNGKRIKIE